MEWIFGGLQLLFIVATYNKIQDLEDQIIALKKRIKKGSYDDDDDY